MMNLVEYFVNPDIEIDNLEENALTRFFMGSDKESLDKLKKEAKTKTITKAKKRELLKEIDDHIDNSNRVFTPSNFKHVMAEAGLNVVLGGLPLLVKVFTRILSSSDRNTYREGMYKVRGIISSIPVKG